MKITKKTRLLAKPVPTIGNICSEGHEDDHFVVRENCDPIIVGTNLKVTGDDQVRYQGFTQEGGEPSGCFPIAALKVNTDTRLVLDRTKVQGDPFAFLIGSDVSLGVRDVSEWSAYLR